MSKTGGPDYDRPVRLKSLRLAHSVRIVDHSNGLSTSEYDYIQADKGFVIELTLRTRLVRVWSTRIAKAPVTSFLLPEGMGWQVEGDVESQPEGPRAA